MVSDSERFEPIRLRDPVAPGRRKAGATDSVALWGAFALIGLSIAGYALLRATRDEPPPAPPKIVAADPEPVPAPRPKPTPTPKRARPVPQAAKAAPVVVNHVEPEKKFVDPIEGFDTGEAFDNPASPGRVVRTNGRADRTEAPARQVQSNRPDRPDPSFGRTPQ